MNIYDKFKKMTQDMLDEQADTIKEAFGKKLVNYVVNRQC